MLAGPVIVDAFADVPTDGAAWATLGGIAVGLSAVAGALARVAAIPAVEKVLIRLGLGTGVESEGLIVDGAITARHIEVEGKPQGDEQGLTGE